MKREVGVLLALLGLSVLLPLPAFGQGPAATVTATVTMGSTACLIASPNSVAFGIVAFTQPGAAPQTATASISLHNCSAQAVNVLARGSNASGGATWTLTPGSLGVCSTANTFIQGVRDSAESEKRLSLVNQPFTVVQPGVSTPITLTFLPPCTGSTGGGNSVTLTYIFTATATDR